MNTRILGFVVLVALLAIAVSQCLFIVDQRERALVLHFGKVVNDAAGAPVVYEPGLHFMYPSVDKVIRMDTRIQNLEGTPDRVVTQEKTDLIVDSFVKYRINDFKKFFLATQGDFGKANDLLERNVEDGLRAEFGNRKITGVVSGERTQMMAKTLERTRDKASELGIEVLDVRVKQINVPDEVSASVYRRMSTERHAKATQLRSDGQKKANIIKSQTDANVKIILAEADKESRRIRGEGDATAAKIYADTYKQNTEFYAFLRSLDAYRASFKDSNDIMVVQPDSDFFKYMKDAKGH